jgi:hypothetical protein
MEQIQGGWERVSIQECCLVLVLPSLEVARQPTSWCISAGKEQNVKIKCEPEKYKCEAILECIMKILFT